MAERLRQARVDLEIVEKEREARFVAAHLKVLQQKDDEELMAEYTACNVTCTPNDKGSEAALADLAKRRYAMLHEQLRAKIQELEEQDADVDSIHADVRVMSSHKYHLRCLLHPCLKLTSEAPSEWRESKDKNSAGVTWTNVYTGEQSLAQPASETVILNTKSRAAFLRRFKDWKRTGVVIPVTDTTTWWDLRNKGLSRLLQERLQLLCTSSVIVRTEEDWQRMKATLQTFSLYTTRILVARETLPKERKAAAPLPVGWELHDILPRGWLHVYDEPSGRFKFINGNDSKAEVRWDFPLDSLDGIRWPDGVSEASGLEVRQALGEPPSSVDDTSKVYINYKTQQISWLPPKTTPDICQVRVRIAAGKDGKEPTWLADTDAFIPIVLMEKPPAGGAARELPRTEPSPWRLPYTVEKGGVLGGFNIKPALDWRGMQALLKDHVEPKGTDRIFVYAQEGSRPDTLTRVQSQREWDEFVQSHMLQLRAQLLSFATAGGAAAAHAGSAAAGAASKGGVIAPVNRVRMHIFPENYPDLRIEVLDSLASDDSNLLPVEGRRMLDGMPVEIRAVLPVKQNTPFKVLADELQDLCKAPCVFQFQEPHLITSDAPWLATLEHIFAPLATAAPRQKTSIAKKGDGKRLAQVTLSFDDTPLDLQVDEGTGWLELVGQLRRVAGANTGGVLHDGVDVKDESAYRQMLQRVLKDRFATSNLKTVDEKVLNALRVLWKDDLKEGAIAGELERRKKVADTQGPEAESEGEKMLRVRVEGCQVWRVQGITNKIYVQGQLELGLRHFRFTCREATEEENKALPRYRDKKLAKEGSVKGSVKDSKPLTENKENTEKEKTVAIEIMRRTRKGKEKIKGRLLLQDRGERVFALSHDAGQYFSKVLLQ
jgi:hypothetical protein